MQVAFETQAVAVRTLQQRQVNTRLELDVISKVAALADRLDLEARPAGEQAWSIPMLLVVVFQRLHAQLPPM
jgi:hypothetical protein